ncbi:MAG TPA: hypothetical protein VGB36_14530 [Gammaproteobacteria bacterium]
MIFHPGIVRIKASSAPGLRRFLLGALMAWASFAAPAQFIDEGFESPPIIQPDRVLSASMLASGNHRVLDDVLTRENWLEFQIESDFGNFRPPSVAMVSIRIQEIRTLAQAVDRYKRSNIKLAERLRGQLTVGADSFVDILASPISTTSKIVGQFTDNVGQTFQEFGEFQPQEQRSTGSAVIPYDQFEPGDPILASHKRNIASQLDLDIYSSNPRVQDFLDTLARARSSGQQSAGIVTVSLPDDGRIRVANGRVEASIRAAMTHNTLNQLYRRNADALSRAGVDAEVSDAFLTQALLSPRHKTAITEHIVYLDGVGNRQALLQAALGTGNENEAVAYVQVARLLSSYQERVGALRQLVAAGHVMLATTVSGGLIVVLPYDIVFWNESTRNVFSDLAKFANDRGYSHRGIISAGLFSELAGAKLERLGFEIRPRFLHRR